MNQRSPSFLKQRVYGSKGALGGTSGVCVGGGLGGRVSKLSSSELGDGEDELGGCADTGGGEFPEDPEVDECEGFGRSGYFALPAGWC